MRKVSFYGLGSVFLFAFTSFSNLSFGANAGQSVNSPTSPDKQGILLVAFGSSHPEAQKSFVNIERLVKARFPGIPVRWAFTSAMIRKKLKSRGENVNSVTEALDKMRKDGFTQVAIQSFHIVAGSEYHELINEAAPFRSGQAFRQLTVGQPLLESYQDLTRFIDCLIADLPSKRSSEDAVVLMGHGNRHGNCDLVYVATAAELLRRDPRIFLGTVEGFPDFNTMRSELLKSGAKKAYLMPLMLVAGEHALNDLSGADDDSWKSQLKKDGIEGIPVLKGLGEYDNMANLFIDHLQSALKP